ncbi:NRAMP family divalent metal transporter [Georgenia alba]|uniref:NRAMP family divalent metal transporter n=1 Tax=Georgenia alba TaxID=2233858 RepID=A0ABW2QCW3_9MICO
MSESTTTAATATSYLKARKGALVGAVFLMATSAIGPGFITQTATYTVALGAAFAFGILISILIDIVVQLNVWRMLTQAGKYAFQLANEAIPFSGHVIATLVVFGGLVFNVGNIAGAGLGLNAALGLDPKIGGAISAVLAVGIFLYKRAGLAMDRLVIVLGLVMLALTAYVAVVSGPPVGDALRQTVLPEEIDVAAITTIVGGTVGGYITYSGAHRLVDNGTVGPQNAAQVRRAAITGITLTGIMRYVLFLAILGVVATGVAIDTESTTANPAAQAFGEAAGGVGLRVFGVIMWAAGITSVIGAAYTSVSFFASYNMRALEPRIRSRSTLGFIAVSLVVFLLLGAAPAALLVFAGGFNGLILPIGLTVLMYVGFFRRDLLGGSYSWVLLILGTLVTALSWYMGVTSVEPIFDLVLG